jgi:hypothetical protein
MVAFFYTLNVGLPRKRVVKLFLLITFYEENVCSKEIKCIFASIINQNQTI